MYEILFSAPAKKEFKHLNTEDQVRILNLLERVRLRPHDFAMRLSGPKAYRVRSGKLRIILDLDDELNQMLILKIGNRENVYSP